MTAWILSTVAAGGYGGILLLMALENIFPPIPSELIMGLGGMNVASGAMGFWPLLLAGTIGSTVGNYVWYWVGRRLGITRLRPLVDRWGRWLTIEWQDIERIDGVFRRHGHWIVFVARFSPIFRTMISLPAGMAHMSRGRFLAYTAAGSSLWNIFLIGAGYYLGRNFDAVEQWTGPLTVAIIVTVILVYVWRVLTWRPRPDAP